jgi:GTP cyclohydrolase II
MESDRLLDSFGEARQINIERAVAEFRAGRPVAIGSGDGLVLAFPLECLTDKMLAPILGRNPRLIVPKEKIGPAQEWTAPSAAVHLQPFTADTVESYLGYDPSGLQCAYSLELFAPSEPEAGALALSALALLLPAAIAVDLTREELERLPALTVRSEDIFTYRSDAARSLQIVTRTFVPLEGAIDSEFVIFRGGDGFREQIAVVISKPANTRPVPVRIHSACLTGDLFGSLKCDCGDQLRGTVQAMSEQGGGIILYLDQEGRGNGLANKIRAYALQNEGLDTFEADALLGFGPDQRRFDYAAEMLKLLGYTSIRLMTNNPNKIEALRAAGLDVVSTHRVFARTTVHNVKYLAAKRDKAGHLLGDAALDGVEIDDILRTPMRKPSAN